jgi:hypothetical protein
MLSFYAEHLLTGGRSLLFMISTGTEMQPSVSFLCSHKLPQHENSMKSGTETTF